MLEKQKNAISFSNIIYLIKKEARYKGRRRRIQISRFPFLHKLRKKFALS
jgi:hypothetical protein